MFSSAVDQVVVIRLTCDRPGRLTFAATLKRESDSTTRTVDNGRVVIEGEAIARSERQALERKVGVKFQGLLQVLPEGGSMTASGTDILVEKANAATLVFAAATNFRSKDPRSRCYEYIAAAKKAYGQLRSAHLADHQRLFRRVEFRLAGSETGLPTDERLKRVEQGATDLALEALYFQFGRYLLIASSRPGTMPANLQGIWNDQLHPPWDSKYTININTEMNYWPAEVCNLSELHEPLFDLIEHARERRAPSRQDALWSARVCYTSQHRPLGSRVAYRRGSRGDLADGRRLVESAFVGSLRLHSQS